MGYAISQNEKAHAICLPYPAQGHITPMLNLAKLLHHRGFHTTFINTEYNHRRLLQSRRPDSLDGLLDFQFKTIPNGLPYSEANSTQDIPALCESINKNCLAPFCDLISQINLNASTCSNAIPQVSCVVGDAGAFFSVSAANKFKIPYALFFTANACAYFGYLQYPKLIKHGLVPLKDASYLTNEYPEKTIVNEYLEKTIEWTKGKKNIRLMDLPTFLRTTNPNDIMLNFFIQFMNVCKEATAIILNTYDELEKDVLMALPSFNPHHHYTIGPLHMMVKQIEDEKLRAMGSDLWVEESECIEWLNSKEPNSVVYVNFGSITVITKQLIEFAWGLANSKKSFLWITRPDLIVGDSAILPHEFVTQTKDRSLIASSCCQEQVLKHPSIGGFLTHGGWNSTIESICAGVPMICWPFFADQQTNCCYCCTEWEIGMKIDTDVRRNEVEELVRELMDGEKGKKMKENVMNLKNNAEEAYKLGGCAWKQRDKLIKVLLSKAK